MNLNSQIYKDVLDELKARKFFSPDFKDEIQMRKNHLLFVYDNLKENFSQSALTANRPFLGEASTVEADFVMRKIPSSPIIYQVKNREAQHYTWATRILGEVYVVSPFDLVFFDAYYDNNGCYQRVQKYVSLHDQESPFKDRKMHPTQLAWVYMPSEFYMEQLKFSTTSASQVRKNILGSQKQFWEWRQNDIVPQNKQN